MSLIAVPYLRVSGAGQKAGDGFTRQLLSISSYCKSNKLELGNVYQEDVSGTTSEREQFTQMLMDGHKLIIVEAIDRFTRSAEAYTDIKKLVLAFGADVISSQTGKSLIVHETSIDKFQNAIEVAVAELDKDKLVEKLASARARKRAANGRCEGRKPLGTRDGEKELVKALRSRRRKGITFKNIALEFESQFSNRQGQPYKESYLKVLASRLNIKKK